MAIEHSIVWNDIHLLKGQTSILSLYYPWVSKKKWSWGIRELTCWAWDCTVVLVNLSEDCTGQPCPDFVCPSPGLVLCSYEHVGIQFLLHIRHSPLSPMYRSPKQKKRNKAAKVTKVAIVYLYHVFRKHPKSRTKDLSCERKLVRPAFLLLLSILVHLSLHETTSFNIRQQNMTVSQSTFLHLE